MSAIVPSDQIETQRLAFARDLRESLTRTPPQIAAKYFYDDLGSQLFEAICRLPWYRVTRAEMSLLKRYGRTILAPLAAPTSLVELGCGSGDKLATLLEASRPTIGEIQLVDISPAALEMTTRRLHDLGMAVARAHVASYEDGLELAARHRPAQGALALLFLGSNIGNFDAPVRNALLRHLRRALKSGDALILGADLVKAERDLLLAYDDPLQVTAAFNRNVLRRINDELGGNFDLASFDHAVRWNAAEQRVEMHLVSTRRQRVTIEAAEVEVDFDAGTAIWTESSYKYEPEQIRALGEAAGFGVSTQWIDEDARFALTRFVVEG